MVIILSQLISTLCDKLKQKKIAKLNEASCPDDKSLLAAGWYIVRASVMLAATTYRHSVAELSTFLGFLGYLFIHEK